MSLWVTTGWILTIGHSVLLPRVQTSQCYKPELILLSIRVKQWYIWAYTFTKKRRQVLRSFSEALSQENDLVIYANKRKIWKENLCLIKNQLWRNQNFRAEDNHCYMRYICAKEFALIKLSAKYWFFKKLSQISHIHKIVFFRYNLNF